MKEEERKESTEIKKEKKPKVEASSEDTPPPPKEITPMRTFYFWEDPFYQPRPHLRLAMLKLHIRKLDLQKDEAGFKSQYFYVPLKRMQAEFLPLELEYGITTLYTEETRMMSEATMGAVPRVFAIRKAIDLFTDKEFDRTEIDITNVKIIKDVYGIGKDVLRISEPRDAIRTLLFDYHEPQGLGSISSYFQRYTYGQLYDFQETKEEAQADKTGRLDTKVKVDDVKTPKEERLSDESMEIRKRIKATFDKELIIKSLNGRAYKELSKEELLELEKQLQNPTKEDETQTTKGNVADLESMQNTIKAEFDRDYIIQTLNGRKLKTMSLEELASFYEELLKNKKGE
jgi:hypothetical protein